jgi:hypothetical protein
MDALMEAKTSRFGLVAAGYEPGGFSSGYRDLVIPANTTAAAIARDGSRPEAFLKGLPAMSIFSLKNEPEGVSGLLGFLS